MNDQESNIIKEDQEKESKETNKQPTIDPDIVNQLQEIIKQQSELIRIQKAVKKVEDPIPIQEVFEVMSPGDHVEKIYQDIKTQYETFRNPRKLKDFEHAVWILKRKGFKNEDIADFLIN